MNRPSAFKPALIALIALIALVSVAGAALLPSASAQTVYRCTASTGQVLFSDEPCPQGSQSSRISVAPGNTVDNSALRESMREQRENPPPPQVVTRSDAALPPTGDRATSFECRQAQRDYEVTAGSSGQLPALIEAKRSIMFATCGLREPDRVETPVVPVITYPPVVVQRPVVRPRPVPPTERPCPAFRGDLTVCGPRNAVTEGWRKP